MALTLLLPLLASLQSLPRPVSPADPLPAPMLSLEPKYQVYLPGERVTLTCAAPQNESVSGYRFCFQNEQQKPSTVPRPNAGARLELTEEKESAEKFTRAYWRWKSNQEISSENSSSICITVRDPLAAWEVAAYLSGESGQLTCSAASDEDEITTFQFSKDEGSIFPSAVPPGSSYADVMNSEQRPECSGSYTCWYWTGPSGQEIQSAESPPVSITVIAWPPAPQLAVIPQQHIFLRGESVTLMCSAPRTATVSEIRFFRDGQRTDCREPHQNNARSLQLSSVSESHAGAYSCEYWQTESGRGIPSERSQNITIKVIDPPPQPVLSMDPPSGVLSERPALLLTCTAPGSARERRFHFYKNGTKFDPGNMGSELSTLEPTNSSMNISVLSIARAGPNNTGEFTCGYEQNVGSRWIPSPRSRAVTVTLTASSCARDILLGAGGVLLLIAALAALLCYCRRKKRVPKTLKSTDGAEPGEHTRNLDPGHDSKGSKVTGAGEKQMEQGSEVTYMLLVLPNSQAHMTQSTNKSKPAEDEHVLYSEVVRTCTEKAAK